MTNTNIDTYWNLNISTFQYSKTNNRTCDMQDWHNLQQSSHLTILIVLYTYLNRTNTH